MKPRVHWVSPLPSAQTDIAHYTRRILPELAQETDLVLWTDAPDWDRALYDFAPVRRLDPDRALPRDFATAGRAEGKPGQGPEAIFVNIGNAWPFHSGFMRMIQRLPSIVVLHDMAIQELCFDAMERGYFPRDVYEANMLKWHGQAGLAAAQEVFEDRRERGDLAREIPGFELTLTRAVSVLTHTPVARDAVAATHTVPGYLLDLPFRPSSKRPEVIRSGVGPMRLVQFGYTGPNRRLQKVLEALAPLRDEIDFHLDVMGSLWDPPYIRQRIQELGLGHHVTLHGFVEEAELDRRLAQAHLVFNLRYPSMGEASGSQMRIWNAAAPAVVTNLGWYADLPGNTVFKIEQDNEITALQSLIRRLQADPAAGRSVAAAGRARLESNHTPAQYARRIAGIAGLFAEDAAARIKSDRLKAAPVALPGLDAAPVERSM
ncbi:glycosyltransferase [Sulfitobacter sp. F26204]|uniref:glycosyltransferase family protein n=1 Tax=Sulfitobacter sp. F26204 TaxID=2996014 RepID=UPI00225E6B02|nr:glycosyltransferase [Sulfitobacter sp. F26204]MCX7561842.1 glycosyltransferase [Sulfitobacter sp. F26204]